MQVNDLLNKCKQNTTSLSLLVGTTVVDIRLSVSLHIYFVDAVITSSSNRSSSSSSSIVVVGVVVFTAVAKSMETFQKPIFICLSHTVAFN